MPTLILMRHAKAATGRRDFTRPLAARGREQAAHQAAPISQKVGQIDLALVSAATRTMQTLAGLQSGGLAVRSERSEEALYGASWREVLELLREVPEDTGSVLVVGHEPTMSHTSVMLASEDSPAQSELQAGFPTATAAIGRVESWAQLNAGGLFLSDVLRSAI